MNSKDTKRLVYDLDITELTQYLIGSGEPTYRAKQIFGALHNGKCLDEISNIPKTLRDKIGVDFYCDTPETVKELVSKDGTRKYLLKLSDASLVECVLLTQDYGHTVCISSQVGCRMGCIFCASGANGFVRNLSAGEMLLQVLLARNQIKTPETRALHVVVMGSGEPFDNFENTMKILRLVTCAEGINIGARNISVSTVGLPDKIREFADALIQVNLCISLHAPNDDVRKMILPMAKKYDIAQVINAAKYFFDKTKRRVIFEYALIDKVNCTEEHAIELAKLLKRANFASHVNLISLNTSASSSPQSVSKEFDTFDAGNILNTNSVNLLKPPSRETAKKFMDTLIKSGVSCTMRKSRGSDIDGACGQLRLRYREKL